MELGLSPNCFAKRRYQYQEEFEGQVADQPLRIELPPWGPAPLERHGGKRSYAPRELGTRREVYEAQVRLYTEAVQRATGEPARGMLLVV